MAEMLVVQLVDWMVLKVVVNSVESMENWKAERVDEKMVCCLGRIIGCTDGCLEGFCVGLEMGFRSGCNDG